MPSTILDSAVFRDIFTTEPMRKVWSDETRVQKYLDFEAALARAQARLKIIPKNAAAEIVKHCNVAEIDFYRIAPSGGYTRGRDDNVRLMSRSAARPRRRPCRPQRRN